MKQWFKGNLHMHSLWSDGKDFPESIAAWFKEQGYHFIAFTEHDHLAQGQRWIDPTPEQLECYRARWDKHNISLDSNEKKQVRLRTLKEYRGLLEEPGKFMILSGEEITTSWPLDAPLDDRKEVNESRTHWINAINLADAVPSQLCEGTSSEAMRQTIEAISKSSGDENTIIFLNHPNFQYNARAEEIVEVDKLGFMEIHTALNSCCCYGSTARAGAERIWDVILSLRLSRNKHLLYGIATDDCHFYHKSDEVDHMDPRAGFPGRAWVMVRSDILTPHAIIAAMKQGDFYASTGVTLSNLEINNQEISLAIEPENGVSYTIQFIGTDENFDQSSQPVLNENGKPLFTTARYSEEVGKVLKQVEGTNASYKFRGSELYVRAIIISDNLHPNPTVPGDTTKAWIQPIAIYK